MVYVCMLSIYIPASVLTGSMVPVQVIECSNLKICRKLTNLRILGVYGCRLLTVYKVLLGDRNLKSGGMNAGRPIRIIYYSPFTKS